IGLARKHVLLACTAYNLKKLMRFKSVNTIAQVTEARTGEIKPVAVSVLTLLFLLYLYDREKLHFQSRKGPPKRLPSLFNV
ncbi:MAG: hypothetical protein LBT35_07105, partial [Tannerella sp.]|nr:hypothetical protein [Tannerella sp.]